MNIPKVAVAKTPYMENIFTMATLVTFQLTESMRDGPPMTRIFLRTPKSSFAYLKSQTFHFFFAKRNPNTIEAVEHIPEARADPETPIFNVNMNTGSRNIFDIDPKATT